MALQAPPRKVAPSRVECDLQLTALTRQLQSAKRGSEERALLVVEIDRWLDLRLSAV